MSTNHQPCRVWSRFKRKRKDDSVLKLRIQDSPSSALGSVLNFIVRYFVTEETFQKAAGIYSNPEAIEEYFELVTEVIKSWTIVICCHDNDTEEVGEILGVSAVHLVRDESFKGIQLQTKENQNLMNIIFECGKLVQPLMKEFEVRHDGRGITVHPDYRCLGIASEFVKTRRLMIHDLNIPMSCAWMTSYGSQRAAEKNNWETVFEINSEELGQIGGVVFKDPPATFKLMLIKNSSSSKH